MIAGNSNHIATVADDEKDKFIESLSWDGEDKMELLEEMWNDLKDSFKGESRDSKRKLKSLQHELLLKFGLKHEMDLWDMTDGIDASTCEGCNEFFFFEDGKLNCSVCDEFWCDFCESEAPKCGICNNDDDWICSSCKVVTMSDCCTKMMCSGEESEWNDDHECESEETK